MKLKTEIKPLTIVDKYWHDLRRLSSDARRLLLAGAFFGLCASGFSVIYNLYLLQLGMGGTIIGEVSAASVLGLAVAGIPSGYLIERFKPQPLAICSIIFYVITMSLRATLSTELLLLVTAFLNGITSTLVWVSITVLLAGAASTRDRSLVFSLNGLIAGLIGIPGNLLAGALPPLYQRTLAVSLLWGERMTLLSMMVFALPAVLFLLRLDSSSRSIPNSRGALPASPPSRELRPVFIAIAIVATLFGLAEGLFFPFGNIFFQERYHYDTDRIGFVFAVNQLLVVLLFIALPVLTRYWKKSTIMSASRLVLLPFMAVLMLDLPEWLVGSSYVVAHTTFGTSMTLEDNIFVEVVPESQRGQALGIRAVFLSLGAAVANAAGGWLIENTGFFLPVLGSTILSAVLAVAVFYFFAHREPVPSALALMAEEAA